MAKKKITLKIGNGDTIGSYRIERSSLVARYYIEYKFYAHGIIYYDYRREIKRKVVEGMAVITLVGSIIVSIPLTGGASAGALVLL